MCLIELWRDENGDKVEVEIRLCNEGLTTSSTPKKRDLTDHEDKRDFYDHLWNPAHDIPSLISSWFWPAFIKTYFLRGRLVNQQLMGFKDQR